MKLEGNEDIEEQIKHVQAVNKLLQDYSSAQAETIRQLKNTIVIISICFTVIICTMIAGFFWYESQFEIVETTQATTETNLSTEGENATINNVTDGDMYNDSSVHNEY